MKNLVKILWASVMVALPIFSFSHPGHGHDNPLSPGHYVGNPEHALPLALTIAVAAIFIAWKVRRAKNEAKK
jgi:hypothetical protein